MEEETFLEQPFNAADETQVNERRKQAGRNKKQKHDYTKMIMSTTQGRKWMFDLLGECRVFGNPIITGDTHATYSNLGQQNIGKKLLQDLNESAPDEYILMMKEAR